MRVALKLREAHLSMDRVFIVLGSLAACLAVALGAFGRHRLEATLSEPMRAAYETGVHYQLIHAVAVLVVGCILHTNLRSRLVVLAGWMLMAGMVLFCGSLYLMAVTSLEGVAALAPFGGLAFLLGWLFLGLGMSKSRGTRR